MMRNAHLTKAHFIEIDTNKMVGRLYIEHVPRVGEECRFHGEKYYRVELVVHVYDEDGPEHRVNIGVARIGDVE